MYIVLDWNIPYAVKSRRSKPKSAHNYEEAKTINTIIVLLIFDLLRSNNQGDGDEFSILSWSLSRIHFDKQCELLCPKLKQT